MRAIITYAHERVKRHGKYNHYLFYRGQEELDAEHKVIYFVNVCCVFNVLITKCCIVCIYVLYSDQVIPNQSPSCPHSNCIEFV